MGPFSKLGIEQKPQIIQRKLFCGYQCAILGFSFDSPPNLPKTKKKEIEDDKIHTMKTSWSTKFQFNMMNNNYSNNTKPQVDIEILISLKFKRLLCSSCDFTLVSCNHKSSSYIR